MTSLDATALLSDPTGMEFLRAVLDASEQPAIPVGAFDPSAIRLGWTTAASGASEGRRDQETRVSEAV